MIEFTKKELTWIKANMQKVLDIYDNGTKEELKEYIHEVRGESLDQVLFYSGNDWRFFIEKDINENNFYNKIIVDYCVNGLGMWYWRDCDMNTAEEIYPFVEDITYCQIAEKIFKSED